MFAARSRPTFALADSRVCDANRQVSGREHKQQREQYFFHHLDPFDTLVGARSHNGCLRNPISLFRGARSCTGARPIGVSGACGATRSCSFGALTNSSVTNSNGQITSRDRYR